MIPEPTERRERVMTADDIEIGFMPATEMRARFQRRELSPVEVTAATLRRLEAWEPSINAFVTVTADLAMARARQAEADYRSGTARALSGIPITIKDLVWTKGIPTQMGSRLWEGFVPEENAPFVERVLDAGAVVIGKTTSPEFGWKGETTSPLTGTTRNPWNRERTPGGSSGGAAAACAAGIGPLAQGSDGAGSIRIPCSFSGLFGLKPSFGLVPYHPASRVPDLSHMGPMTRTVADSALLMNVTAGADHRDRSSWSSGLDYLDGLDRGIAGLRVAWTPDLGYAPIDPEVRSIAERAAARFVELGCEVEEAYPGLPDPWKTIDTIWCSGMAAMHRDNLAEVRDKIDPGRLAVVERGLDMPAVDLVLALNERTAYTNAWHRFMERYDLLLTPTLPCTAFPTGQDNPSAVDGRPTTYLGWTAFTYPFNLTGQPAASLPCGFDAAGLPVGLQIVGRWRDDATVLRASAAFERLAPWAQLRPPQP
jgi:aspartyl-tRNA(Asn)/glutamyl-tRNA(Gln) amidotransferase subunit A